MGVYEKLAKLQSEIKAPKDIYNRFGDFYYRNCESILNAAKPLMFDMKATILLTDEIVQMDSRYYVKATAKFIDLESPENVVVSAYAREPQSKAKMDDSQATGSASSYARKYALSGLLLLDDAKDPDTDAYAMMILEDDGDDEETSKESNEIEAKGKELKAYVDQLAKEKKFTKKKALDITRKHGAGSLTSLSSVEQYEKIKADIEKEVSGK